jgi:hypothetical protein
MFSTKNCRPQASSFQIIKDSMLQGDALPLAEVIDNDNLQAVFDRHGVNFGNDPAAIYTPAITLWALISQVFFKGENRSCKSAVTRIASLYALLGKVVCGANTGAYCRARMKMPFQVVRDIALEIGLASEAAYQQQALDEYQGELHPIVAQVQSEPLTGRILLVDGFTVTAADTPENQAEFPQNPSQKEGLGFPIIRGVSLVSMITGLLIALELGPYAGKQTGETALLWKMLDQLKRGDTLVADCFYCTYWLVAAVLLTVELIQLGLRTSSSENVGKRLDRVEPRANKRRPKLLALLTKPRRIAQQNLTHAA